MARIALNFALLQTTHKFQRFLKFQITVKGNTDLIGGVIESTKAATDNNKNTLTTATLTSRDIQNKSEYSAQSISGHRGQTTVYKRIKVIDREAQGLALKNATSKPK